MFSSTPFDEEDKEQAIIDAQMKSQTGEKKGKFSAFLATAEDIDQKVQDNANFAKSVEGDESVDPMEGISSQMLDFDSGEIDIDFNFQKEI